MRFHTCNNARRKRVLWLVLAVLGLLILALAGSALAAPPSDSVFLPKTPINVGTTPPYDAYSSWAYTWDRDYNGLLNPVEASMNGIANLLMLVTTLLTKYCVKIVLAAFSTDLVVGFTNAIAMPFVNAMRSYLWDEYAPYVIGFAGMTALFYRLKQESTRAWGTLIGLVAVLLVSLWSFNNLGDFVVMVDGSATNISAAVFTGAASINPNMPAPPPGVASKDQALNYAGTQIFNNVVGVPWCIGQFGSISTCREQGLGDGVYGSKWLAENADKREDLVDQLSKDDKAWMQSNMAVMRVVVGLIALLIALVSCLFLLLMGGLVIFWQIWAAVLLAVFPFIALMALWPGAEIGLKRWFGKLLGALFMKVGLALVLAVVLAFSSALWNMMESWPVAVFLQLALTAGIVINRHLFAGLITGFADAGLAMGGAAALSNGPTGGFIGSVASDAVRRGTRDWMLGTVARGTGWVTNIPSRRREAQMDSLAEKSLMGRYAEEKRLAAQTDRPSQFVAEVNDRLQRGEAAFSPEQLIGEKMRLQAIKDQGGDPRRALLRSVDTDNRNSYTQAQQAWEAEIAAVKQEFKSRSVQYGRLAQDNVQRQYGVGKVSTALGSVLTGGRKAPVDTPAAGPGAMDVYREERRQRFEVRQGGRAAVSRPAAEGAGTGGKVSSAGSAGKKNGAENSELRQAPHMAKAAGAEPPISAQPIALQNAPIIKDGVIIVPADAISGRTGGGETQQPGVIPVQYGPDKPWYGQVVTNKVDGAEPGQTQAPIPEPGSDREKE